MVAGMDTFRRHFAGFENAFVIIGGAACDLWFTRVGGRFRATKDIDMVLLLESAHAEFFARFWDFIRQGRYEIAQRAESGKRTLFRFQKPAAGDYPAMIELLSTIPENVEPFPGQRIVPIPAGEDLSSLSAILMNPDYYRFILSQREVVDGLPLIRPAGLIPLKAHAWLDLTRRLEAGETSIKQDDINKHRSDVFRLGAILPVGESVALPSVIADDLRAFLGQHPATSPEWTAISQSLATTGIRIPAADLLATLHTFFGLTP